MATTSPSSAKLNVGRYDRSIRLVVGLVLLALAVFSLNGAWAVASGIIGIVLLGTGFFGFCPIYRLFGLNTCAVRPAKPN